MLVDSNILVYAINRSSPKHKKAQTFLLSNIGNLEIAHQNIFETLRVLTHRKFQKPMNPKDAIGALERIFRACTVISPDYKTHQITLSLMKKYTLSGDEIFDCYLVATALANHIDTIATDNVRDFKKFKEIAVHNPFE